jgi:hypothetical protein
MESKGVRSPYRSAVPLHPHASHHLVPVLSTHSNWKPPSSATELGGDRAGGEAMAPAAAGWGGRNERGRGLGRARVGVKAAAGGQGQDRQVAARFQRGTFRTVTWRAT